MENPSSPFLREKEMATHSSILAWRTPMDRGAWWATVHRVVKESDPTEGLSNSSGEQEETCPSFADIK